MTACDGVSSDIRPFLFVGPFPPPYGGIASHLLDLTRVLDRSGYVSHVLAYTDGDSTTESVGPHTTVHRRRARPSLGVPITLLRNPAGLIRQTWLWMSGMRHDWRLYTSALARSALICELIDRHRAGVVSIYGTPDGAVVPFLRAARPDVRILYWVFAGPYVNPQFYEKHRRLFQRAMLVSDEVVATSEYCARVVGMFTDAVQASVVYIGVDLERFNPGLDGAIIRKRLGITRPNVVLFVGRMEPEMGADNALEIARQVCTTRDDVAFLVCGARGSLTETLESAAAASGGRIRCIPNVPGDELPLYYAAADVAIAPTVGAHACMGVTIKEAMACGRACVATDSGGIPEAIRTAREGVIVPLRPDGGVDNEGFSQAIQKLCDDPESRRRLGENGRRRAEHLFSHQTMAQKVLDLLRKPHSAPRPRSVPGARGDRR